MKKIVSFIFCVFLAQQIFAVEIYPGEKDTLTSFIFNSGTPYNSYDISFRDLPEFLEFKTLEVYSIYSWFTYKYYIQFELNAQNDAPFADTTFYMDFEFSINETNKRFDTVAVNVSIQNPKIIAGFTTDINVGSNPLTVSFTNLSTGKYTDLLWDFGDGEISSEENPVHLYDSTGTFDLQLIALNETSADTFFQENYIRVFNMPTGKVTGDKGICPGDSTEITFTFSGLPPWDFTWGSGVEQFDKTTSDSTFVIFAKTESSYFLTSLRDANDTTIFVFNDTAKVWLNPVPEKPEILYNKSVSICEGETIQLNATAGFDVYQWTNGGQTEIIEVTQSMQIAVRVANQFACFSDFSDTLEIEVLDLPSKPVITQNLDTLEIIEVDSIQWYLNGDTISGATANKLEIDKSGSYYVEVFNKNRCKNVSDEMYYVYSESNLITKAEDKFKIIPNPFTDRINIIYSGNRTDLISWEIIQLDGKVVKLKNL
ncbi:MAG: PKD domain-containing protein, partial [Prolixibacteraceae bacterium]|nr:PKD domain-containing protein [Prolixibacteraceae bacterium]